MKRSWTFAPGGAIWRVHPAVSGRIIGEERDLKKRTVTFFALEFPSGTVLWKRLGAQEQWWTGIDRVEGDLLFVHGFASPDLPVHQGITVVDIPLGKVLWSNSAWTLEGVNGDQLIVRGDHRSGQGTLVVHSRNGDILSDTTMHDPVSPAGRPWWEDVAFPDAVSVEQLSTHPAGAVVLKRWDPDRISGTAELLDQPPFLFVSAAIRRKRLRGDSLDHALLVADQRTGKIVHDATLAHHARGPVMESFFVQEGILVYVKEGTMLCGARVRGA